MHHVTMYLDFVSPYAWLAFQQLPHSMQGLSLHVAYRPVLLGALLQQNGNPGPVGIPAKRVWTYQHALWLAQQMDIPLQLPATHPFNPLPLLRLALQTSTDGSISRFVAETCFRHVWENGGDPLSAPRMQELHDKLHAQLPAPSEPSDTSKQWLRRNTDKASASGVFGVPAFEANGQVFWGLDSLPILRDFLNGNPWFISQPWESTKSTPSGLA